jgi:hypothetical protein
MEWRGMDLFYEFTKAWCGQAWLGSVRCGVGWAWCGMARLGWAGIIFFNFLRRGVAW